MDLTRPHRARPVRLTWNFWWYGTGDSLEGLLRGSAPTCFTLTVKIKGPGWGRGRGRGRVLAVSLKVSSGDLCQYEPTFGSRSIQLRAAVNSH